MKSLAAIVLLASTSFVAPPDALEYEFVPPAFARDQAGEIFNYYLPPRDGFTGTINLTVQHWEKDLDAYDQVSRNGFEQLKLKVIAGGIADGELTYEYTGKMHGHNLRWYSRAIKQGSKIYLITAATVDKHWEEDSPALIKSVNSFRLKIDDKALR